MALWSCQKQLQFKQKDFCRDNAEIEIVLEFELLKVDYHPLFTAPTEWLKQDENFFIGAPLRVF